MSSRLLASEKASRSSTSSDSRSGLPPTLATTSPSALPSGPQQKLTKTNTNTNTGTNKTTLMDDTEAKNELEKERNRIVQRARHRERAVGKWRLKMGMSSLAALFLIILIASLVPIDLQMLISQVGGPSSPPQADNVTSDFNSTATVNLLFRNPNAYRVTVQSCHLNIQNGPGSLGEVNATDINLSLGRGEMGSVNITVPIDNDSSDSTLDPNSLAGNQYVALRKVLGKDMTKAPFPADMRGECNLLFPGGIRTNMPVLSRVLLDLTGNFSIPK